jgi:hypothetical protein
MTDVLPAALQHLQVMLRAKHVDVTPGVENGRPVFTISSPEDEENYSVTIRFERKHHQWRPTDKFRINKPDGSSEELDGGIMAALRALGGVHGTQGTSPVGGPSDTKSTQVIRTKKKTVIRV